MAKITFPLEQLEFLISASDILLRNTGSAHLKEIIALQNKLESEDADFDTKDTRIIQQLCDVVLRASGIAQIRNVLAILNTISVIEK